MLFAVVSVCVRQENISNAVLVVHISVLYFRSEFFLRFIQFLFSFVTGMNDCLFE